MTNRNNSTKFNEKSALAMSLTPRRQTKKTGASSVSSTSSDDNLTPFWVLSQQDLSYLPKSLVAGLAEEAATKTSVKLTEVPPIFETTVASEVDRILEDRRCDLPQSLDQPLKEGNDGDRDPPPEEEVREPAHVNVAETGEERVVEFASTGDSFADAIAKKIAELEAAVQKEEYFTQELKKTVDPGEEEEEEDNDDDGEEEEAEDLKRIVELDISEISTNETIESIGENRSDESHQSRTEEQEAENQASAEPPVHVDVVKGDTEEPEEELDSTEVVTYIVKTPQISIGIAEEKSVEEVETSIDEHPLTSRSETEEKKEEEEEDLAPEVINELQPQTERKEHQEEEEEDFATQESSVTRHEDKVVEESQPQIEKEQKLDLLFEEVSVSVEEVDFVEEPQPQSGEQEEESEEELAIEERSADVVEKLEEAFALEERSVDGLEEPQPQIEKEQQQQEEEVTSSKRSVAVVEEPQPQIEEKDPKQEIDTAFQEKSVGVDGESHLEIEEDRSLVETPQSEIKEKKQENLESREVSLEVDREEDKKEEEEAAEEPQSQVEEKKEDIAPSVIPLGIFFTDYIETSIIDRRPQLEEEEKKEDCASEIPFDEKTINKVVEEERMFSTTPLKSAPVADDVWYDAKDPTTPATAELSSASFTTPGSTNTLETPPSMKASDDVAIEAVKSEDSAFFCLQPATELIDEQKSRNQQLEQENVWLHKQLVKLAEQDRKSQFMLTEEIEAARKAEKEKREAEAEEKRLQLQKENEEFQRALKNQHGRDSKHLSKETEQKRLELERRRKAEQQERTKQLHEQHKQLMKRLADAKSPTYYQKKLATASSVRTDDASVPEEPQEEETLEQKRERFYKLHNERKELEKEEMKRHVEKQKEKIRKVNHGRDAKRLDAQTNAQRKALQEKRRQDAMKKKAELDAENQKQRERQRKIRAGRDRKSLDAPVEAKRKSLMEQRRLEKEQRQAELRRQNEEYKQRLKRAQSPIHSTIHKRKEAIRTASGSASRSSSVRPKALFPGSSELSLEARHRNCTNRSLTYPHKDSSRRGKAAPNHYLPKKVSKGSTTSRTRAVPPGTGLASVNKGDVAGADQVSLSGADIGLEATASMDAVSKKRLEKAQRREQELREYNKSLVQRLAALSGTATSSSTSK